MRRAFKYKAAVNQKTEKNAQDWLGLCQRLYNAALEQRIDAFQRCGKTVSEFDQAKELKVLKQDFPEYQTVGSQVLKDVLRRLDRAYRAFFRRVKAGSGKAAGFPKFQPYRRYHSFTFPNSSGWSLNGRYLDVMNVGRFKLRPDRPVQGTIATVTVKTTPTGKWFVVFSCKDVPEHPLPKTGKTIGLQLGITHFSTDSEGHKVDNPRCYEKAEKRLRVLQRKLSRSQKGSKRREQVRLEIAQLHEKIANQREDFICKLAHTYAKGYDRIAVGKLNIKGMTRRNREHSGLPKRIHDAAWGQFHFKVESQCEDHGREFKQPDAAKTTMTCSRCGVEKEMPLHMRVYECSACGLVLERTLNSALNIEAKAFRE